MLRDLAYDVGVYDGSDTAYYLSKGFKVVGIEANPSTAEKLAHRFSSQIASGTFRLLNVGVAEEEGELEFWACDDRPEWSSFNRAHASRNGAKHHAVRIRTRRFSDVLAEEGIPFYCKIDIEGHDRVCLEGITRDTAPPYISVEMNHRRGDDDLAFLESLGYSRFKIISQTTWAQPNKALTSLAFNLPRRVAGKLRKAERAVRGKASDGEWRFKHGSSGRFGEETPGRWRSYPQTLTLWRFLHDIDAKHGTQGMGDWYDIHAAQP